MLKGLWVMCFRMEWNDLACFRPFDVRLLFGPRSYLKRSYRTRSVYEIPPKSNLQSSPYGKPIPNRPFVSVEKQGALIFDGRLEHPPCGLIPFEQFLELIYLVAKGDRQGFDPHCQADGRAHSHNRHSLLIMA